MTTDHASFTLEQRIAAPPGRVFRLWADPALKRHWFADGDGPEWETLNYTLDFRVGGSERGQWRLSGESAYAGVHGNETVFLDIVPDQRIVFAYSMALDGRNISASLATVLFEPAGKETRLRFTEQIAMFDGADDAAGRRAGWQQILETMTRFAMEKTHA